MKTLNTDQLDRLIRNATAVWGQTITMQNSISTNRFGEGRFNAECEQDLVGASGVFAKVLTECKLGTFNSALTCTPEDGYKAWFSLHLSYKHFDGGSNGMSVANFWFETGEWKIFNYKDEEK